MGSPDSAGASSRLPSYTNVSGSKNTADGHNSLHFTTGGKNTACGFAAGYGNVSGSQNTLIDTLIGTYADTAANNLTSATVIGFVAIVDASNEISIGNIAVCYIGAPVNVSATSDMRLKKRQQ